MEARSSQDLACCWRATASARSKYVCAFPNIRLRRLQRDPAGEAIRFGLAPPLLGFFDCVERFANATLSVIELVKINVRNSQM
jgi:hypothetical protein